MNELLYIPLALIVLVLIIALGNYIVKDKPQKETTAKTFPFWTVVFSVLLTLVISTITFVLITQTTKCKLTEEQLKLVQEISLKCINNGGTDCAKKAEKEVCNLIDFSDKVRANNSL